MLERSAAGDLVSDALSQRADLQRELTRTWSPWRPEYHQPREHPRAGADPFTSGDHRVTGDYGVSGLAVG